MNDPDSIIVYEDYDVDTNEDRYVVFSEKTRHYIKLRFKRGVFDPEYIMTSIENAKRQLREENKMTKIQEWEKMIEYVENDSVSKEEIIRFLKAHKPNHAKRVKILPCVC